MKKINFSFYFILVGSLLPGFLLVIFLALYPQPADFSLFHLITNYKNDVLETAAGYGIEPKFWIPYYNLLLILLFTTFGRRFYRVMFGALALIFVVYFIAHWSTLFGFADNAYFNPSKLSSLEIGRLKKWSLFSYQHIALVFAIATYLSILLGDYYNWYKVLFFLSAFLVFFSCVYSGSILPFSAFTACFIGNITACLLCPFYVQKFIYPENEQ